MLDRICYGAISLRCTGCTQQPGSLLCPCSLRGPCGPLVQVLNTCYPQSLQATSQYGALGGVHWLTVSNTFSTHPSQVKIYDSYNTEVWDSVKTFILGICANLSRSLYLKKVSVERQGDSISCGLYALAYAFDLCLGIDPEGARYSDKLMRQHVLHCLKHQCVAPFPRVEPIVAGGRPLSLKSLGPGRPEDDSFGLALTGTVPLQAPAP